MHQKNANFNGCTATLFTLAGNIYIKIKVDDGSIANTFLILFLFFFFLFFRQQGIPILKPTDKTATPIIARTCTYVRSKQDFALGRTPAVGRTQVVQQSFFPFSTSSV